jgi:hypothetical protein
VSARIKGDRVIPSRPQCLASTLPSMAGHAGRPRHRLR